MGSSCAPERRRRRAAALALALAAAALASGCYWSKYDKLVRTHVALLQAMADKIVEVTEADGTPASLAEYRYPLERARDFARIVGRRYAGRESLTAFLAFCDAYERILHLVEARSGRDGTSDDPAILAAARAALVAQAARVLAALDRERAG
jgi:hypothetical protein